MNEIQSKLKNIMDLTLSQFNENEKYLLENNLSERCICSKFASYLEKTLIDTEFANYIVDVEYNRGREGNPICSKMLDGKNIVVDLIVHKRGYDKKVYGFDNLICIEMKKSNDSRGENSLQKDINRLERLTNINYGFNYKIGFMIMANMETFKLECYIDPILLH